MTWISEKDYRQAKAAGFGIGLNTAFIREIKEDNVEFRDLFGNVENRILSAPNTPDRNQVAADLHALVSQLRDELETYFALEEFYGGYRAGGDSPNPSGDVSQHIVKLRAQHVDLYLELEQIVESFEKIVYSEAPLDGINAACNDFLTFCQHMRDHENYEMEVIMRQCNEDLGTCD